MSANHLRPTPPVPLIASEEVARERGSIPAAYDDAGNVTRTLLTLVRTYGDGSRTICVKDPADHWSRWTVETPLTSEVSA